MAIELVDLHSPEVQKFYSEKFYFSYSGLNKLLFSPRVFYKHYILDQKEERTDTHLIEGSLLHCLLLEQDKFDEKFILLPGKIPTDSNKAIIDGVFYNHYLQQEDDNLELSDFPDQVLEALVSVNLYQSLKTDEQRLEKIMIENNKEYFEFLKKKEGKAVIDDSTLTKVKESVEYIKANKLCTELLQLNKPEISSSELPLKIELDSFPFGLKGIVDNVVIDKESKTIFINDIKTTGKSIQHFPESIDYYRYDLQAAIYYLLVRNCLLLQEDEGWKIAFTFIVIDKFNQVYPFQVKTSTMNDWIAGLWQELNKAKYHYEQKEYGLPYDLAKYNVML
jgi:hypothetical protein